MKKLILIVLLSLALFLSYSFASSITSSIYMMSEDGEYIWWWLEQEFSTDYWDEISIKYSSYSDAVEFKLESDQIQTPYNFGFEIVNWKLNEWLYEDATRLAFKKSYENWLEIYGNGRWCNQLLWDFEVRYVDRDWDEINSALIQFSQFCDNSDKVLYWIIAYNEDDQWCQNALEDLEEEFAVWDEDDTYDYVPDSDEDIGLLSWVMLDYIEKIKLTTIKFLPEYNQYCTISIDNPYVFDCLETQESTRALEDIEEAVVKAWKLRKMLESHFGIYWDVEYISELLSEDVNIDTIKKDILKQLEKTEEINYRITSIARLMRNWTKQQKDLVRALQWTIQIDIDALNSALDNL